MGKRRNKEVKQKIVENKPMETKVTAGKKVLNTLKSVKDSCIKVLSNLGKKKDCGCKKG